MAISWSQRRKSQFLIGVVAVHCAAMMLFFVTGRFRLIMLPVLVLFAAEAVSWAFDCVRSKQLRALALAGGIALLLFVLTNSEAVLRSDPDAYESKLRAEEHYYRGTMLSSKMGRPEEAKVELNKALELEPDFVAIAYNLAHLYEESGDYVTALRLYRRSLAITERSPAERYAEPAVYDYIRKIAEKLGEDETQPEPIRRFAEGIGCLNRRSWDCAIVELRAASVDDHREEVAPLLGLAYLGRGREHLRAAHDSAALSDLIEASTLRPHDALVYVELGVALTRADRFGEARSAFGKFRIYDLPRGGFYRRAIKSADEEDRAIALAAARAIAHHFPLDRRAQKAVDLLSR
jgi:tetratricopeptide (TPR) repeat protein